MLQGREERKIRATEGMAHGVNEQRSRGTRPIFRHGCLKLVGVTSLNARDTRRKIKLHAEGTHYAASNVTRYHASGASSNDARTEWRRGNILFRSFPFCHEATFLFAFSRVPPSFSLYLYFYLPPFFCSFTLFLPVCLSVCPYVGANLRIENSNNQQTCLRVYTRNRKFIRRPLWASLAPISIIFPADARAFIYREPKRPREDRWLPRTIDVLWLIYLCDSSDTDGLSLVPIFLIFGYHRFTKVVEYLA